MKFTKVPMSYGLVVFLRFCGSVHLYKDSAITTLVSKYFEALCTAFVFTSVGVSRWIEASSLIHFATCYLANLPVSKTADVQTLIIYFPCSSTRCREGYQGIRCDQFLPKTDSILSDPSKTPPLCTSALNINICHQTVTCWTSDQSDAVLDRISTLHGICLCL